MIFKSSLLHKAVSDYDVRGRYDDLREVRATLQDLGGLGTEWYHATTNPLPKIAIPNKRLYISPTANLAKFVVGSKLSLMYKDEFAITHGYNSWDELECDISNPDHWRAMEPVFWEAIDFVIDSMSANQHSILIYKFKLSDIHTDNTVYYHDTEAPGCFYLKGDMNLSGITARRGSLSVSWGDGGLRYT